MREDTARGKDVAVISIDERVHDQAAMDILWRVEKWSEEACDLARSRLKKLGKKFIQDGVRLEIMDEETWDNLLQRMVPKLIVVPNMISIEKGVTSNWLRSLVGGPSEVLEVHGNLLLNEGIQELWDLAIAAGGTTAYNNANAEIGVGDSTTAAAATQTDLQAASNKLFKAMVATYPQRTNQTVDFRSDFTSGEANFAWQEWGTRNGNTRNKNLNRKVESLGTKSSGTWTMTASLTLS